MFTITDIATAKKLSKEKKKNLNSNKVFKKLNISHKLS